MQCMATVQLNDTLEMLGVGVVDLGALELLEELDVRNLCSDLSPSFPVRFLELRRGRKREFGLAQSRRKGKYRRCLLLTCESDALTTLALIAFIRIRQSREASAESELTTGGGFSLYHDPDGWKVKLLEERTVSLTRETLIQRGWKLD
jgi:hypothetical protein